MYFRDSTAVGVKSLAAAGRIIIFPSVVYILNRNGKMSFPSRTGSRVFAANCKIVHPDQD